jgi:hypothetical protein
MKEVQMHKIVSDGALISSRDWEDVKGKPLSSITGDPDDKEVLDGLIISGYETKFADGTNTNGEQFLPTCLDKFIQEYYVDKKLNMPLDIQHNMYDPQWLAGRIVYVEVDGVGFKYIAYIPRTYMHYEEVKNLLSNKILQGFSKFGWATKGHWKDDDSEEWGGHFLVEEMAIVSMSLVATPANGIPFEEVGEIANATRFKNNTKKQPKVSNGFAAMFNNK